METGKKLQVMYEDRLVGTLALTANHKVAFEYDDAWLEEGFSISPFSLPLKKQVFIPNKDYFEGLFGVFADSLPDAWGRLLLRRLLLAHKQQPDDWTVLDRLAVVGRSGMGALTYRPQRELSVEEKNDNLDELGRKCGGWGTEDVASGLFAAGGSECGGCGMLAFAPIGVWGLVCRWSRQMRHGDHEKTAAAFRSGLFYRVYCSVRTRRTSPVK